MSSSAAEVIAPRGGVDLDNLDFTKEQSAMVKYAVSKGRNVLHSIEYQTQYKNNGVVSIVSCSPYYSMVSWVDRIQALHPA